jgi:Fe-S cluster assembly protein SufD
VFTGRIVVSPGAQKTDAKQTNKNLLLSNEAQADSKPQLEIYADDVKCTHGATVGQLDEEAVFYLRSRGIDEDAARSLLVYAFAQEGLNEIQVEAVRKELAGQVRERLPNGELLREER